MIDMQEIFLETPPEHIAYLKFIFESYEEVGIVRTVDRRKAIIVLLTTPDYTLVAREILLSLKQEVPLTEIGRPADISADWLLTELAAESGEDRS